MFFHIAIFISNLTIHHLTFCNNVVTKKPIAAQTMGNQTKQINMMLNALKLMRHSFRNYLRPIKIGSRCFTSKIKSTLQNA